ncbi:MAG: hypothetical protein AAB407_01205 [Patescibacteria group bacterium]
MPDKTAAFPTQEFIEAESVQDGTVILKNGGIRQILVVSGVNFDLKSEEEQGMIINGFQNFFNSLDFTVQIFIHSRKLNIDAYLESVSMRETQEPNELLRNLIGEYREFIKAFITENAIMSKSFFVIVPYNPVSLSEGGEAITGKIFGFLKSKGIQKPIDRLPEGQNKDEQLRHNIDQLSERVNEIVNGLNQMDLRAIPLNTDEVIELLYNLYNPDAIEKKGIGAEPKS